MNLLIILAVAIVVIAAGVTILKLTDAKPVVKVKKKTVIPANSQRAMIKERRKEEIMEFISKNGRITSRETEALAGVSSATATRYLQELVEEGKAKQKGSGRSVHYTL